MHILPITQNNTNFQAVNMKYLKKAQDDYKYIKDVTGDLLECISNEFIFKAMTKQDALDTLDAISPYAKKDWGWNKVYNLIKNYPD